MEFEINFKDNTRRRKMDWQIGKEALELTKQLGQGNFGEVWLGTYDGTPVAIKKLFPFELEKIASSLHSGEEGITFEKYFEREVDALVKLRHPFIVQLIGICLTEENIYIVTDYVEGGDLHKKLIDPGWAINWKRRMVILINVASAMIYLHGKGIFLVPFKCD